MSIKLNLFNLKMKINKKKANKTNKKERRKKNIKEKTGNRKILKQYNFALKRRTMTCRGKNN